MIAAAWMTGCTTDLGPVVRDVHVAGDGRLELERCNVHGSYSFYVTRLSYTDCRTETRAP